VVTETTGSCLVVNATVAGPTLDPQMRVPCQVHAVDGQYFMSSFSKTAGMALKWFRDQFCEAEIEQAEKEGRSAFEIMGEKIAEVPAGSDGLIMLPYLAGAAFPESNENARGVFFGLSLKHGRWHMGRALMEAVAFLLKAHVEAVRSCAGEVDQIISIGGGAHSRLWCQIKADVLNMPVLTLKTEEPSLLGAAVLAGLAAGVYEDVASASAQMVAIKERLEPDAATGELYREPYALFLRLYERLADVFPAQRETV
jgi:xylulokinase